MPLNHTNNLYIKDISQTAFVFSGSLALLLPILLLR
jgi:hypothetical protein